MKQSVAFSLGALFVGGLMGIGNVNAENIHISTPNTSLVLDANKGESLKILHYGEKISDVDLVNLKTGGVINNDAYPVFGYFPQGDQAMVVTHTDGNRSLDVVVDDVITTTTGDGNVVTVVLKDKVYPFTINVNYKTYPGEDMKSPETVAKKALKDAKKGKDVSVCGSYVKFTHFLSKIIPQKTMMKLWLKQQKIK